MTVRRTPTIVRYLSPSLTHFPVHLSPRCDGPLRRCSGATTTTTTSHAAINLRCNPPEVTIYPHGSIPYRLISLLLLLLCLQSLPQ